MITRDGEAPKQPHLAAIFDEYEVVGRTDVSDIIERAINKIPGERRLFPDLYAHRVTAALLEAGVVAKPRELPVHLLMICNDCGESFVPADEEDVIHGVREYGEMCGGQGRWA